MITFALWHHNTINSTIYKQLGESTAKEDWYIFEMTAFTRVMYKSVFSTMPCILVSVYMYVPVNVNEEIMIVLIIYNL